ncbi:MAG: DUF3108 domain-containing protein [Saprospiraceae bacterium]|nr:DUF3108 domain-containing protein [Saprospiraceae bacterium]
MAHFVERVMGSRLVGKFSNKLKSLDLYDNVTLNKVLVLSLVRYLVYFSQYLCIMYFLGVTVSFINMCAGISSIYLIQTGIPLPAFLSVLARGELAIKIWSGPGVDQMTALVATFGLWFINLIIPSLIGLVILMDFDIKNILKKINKDAFFPKIVIIVIFSLVLIGSSAFSNKENNNSPFTHYDVCHMSNATFQTGERLVYKLYYNWKLVWIPAGEVVFTVQDSKTHYEIKAIGKTYPAYEHIFKVNDYFYSKIDKNTLFPSNFVRIVEEGNYRVYDSISFDQSRNIALSFHGTSKTKTRTQLHHFDQCMQDMVSNLYYMRNISTDGLKKGDHLGVKMFFDKEVFPINVAYIGKEKKDIKSLGTFNTLKLVPDVVEGNVFKKGDYMTLWVSDDKNHLPLMIESPVSVGSIKAVLLSHNGLKHSLDSKIND